MSRYYHMLMQADTDNAIKWQAKLGDAALARQTDDAATAYFSAQEMAPIERSSPLFYCRIEGLGRARPRW